MSSGGEVFILDMGQQMKAQDIAKRLIHLSGRSVATSDNQEGITNCRSWVTKMVRKCLKSF